MPAWKGESWALFETDCDWWAGSEGKVAVSSRQLELWWRSSALWAKLFWFVERTDRRAQPSGDQYGLNCQRLCRQCRWTRQARCVRLEYTHNTQYTSNTTDSDLPATGAGCELTAGGRLRRFCSVAVATVSVATWLDGISPGNVSTAPAELVWLNTKQYHSTYAVPAAVLVDFSSLLYKLWWKINIQYAVMNYPVWARERCKISPPRFLAKCRK